MKSTDKETAEEYATKECCTTCANDFCKDKCECWTYAKNGFLAGLEAGRLEWHDLRKDPNDLPISMEPAFALSSRTVLDQNGEQCWYSYRYKQWKNDKQRTDGTYDCKVIAWCDIPKFEEEQDEIN